MPLVIANDEKSRAEIEQTLRNLAQDVAKDIDTIPTILERYGLTPDEYQKIAEQRSFKNMLQLAASEWSDAKNTPERIKLKAALAVEHAIPAVFSSVIDPKEALAGRVQALQALAKVGGLGNAPPPNAGGSGQTFRLQINFSDPKKNIVIEHQTAALPAEVTEPTDLDVNDELM